MSWEELIEEAVKLELQLLVEVDARRGLVVTLRLDQLRVEMTRRRTKKVGSGS